jgi:glycolate oxidase
LVKEFERIVGKDNVFADPADRVTYSYDAAVLDAVVPAMAVRPVDSQGVEPGGAVVQ